MGEDKGRGTNVIKGQTGLAVSGAEPKCRKGRHGDKMMRCVCVCLVFSLCDE